MVKVGRTFGGVNAGAGILRLFYEIVPDSGQLCKKQGEYKTCLEEDGGSM